MWDQIKDGTTIERTIAALKGNGIHALVVPDGATAKAKIVEMVPAGAEVMDMTSVTLHDTGIASELNDSGRYNSVRKALTAMDPKTQGLEKQKLGAAPEWVVGSVHAVTEDGKVMVASNTGSQLPAYASGSPHVIWVVGAQKIVKNSEEGMKRIYDYVLPLESERAKKAYGVSGSAVNKMLIVNTEVNPGRITLIIVKEKLGF